MPLPSSLKAKPFIALPGVMAARLGARGISAAPPAWEPISGLGSALKAWWSADDHGTARMTDDGAGLISSWTDKVGSMAVTAATTLRPTWAATSFNSAYAGVTFDGTVNAMTSTSLGTLPTGAVAGEIWALVTQSDTTSASKVLVKYGAGAATATERGLMKTATPTRARATDGVAFLTETVATFDGVQILGGAWSGTTMGARQNGSDTTPATAVIPTLATGTTRLRFASNNTPSTGNFHNGAIRHVLITTTLTTLQRQQVEGWMAWNVGAASLLPSGHPYKSAAPT